MFKLFSQSCIYIAFCLLDTHLNARVVSTAPVITEIITSLGKGEQLVGISLFCNYPHTKKISRVGTSMQLNYERLIRLNPTMTFIQKSRDKKTIKSLQKLNIKYRILKFNTLQDIINSYTQLAKYFNVPNMAKDFKLQINNALKKIPARLEGKSYLVAISSQVMAKKLKGSYVAGEQTYYSDILSYTKGANVVSRSSYQLWDTEKIIKAKPSFILVIYPERINKLVVAREQLAWQALFVKNQAQVHTLHGNFATVPGPRVVKLIERISGLLRD